MENDKQFRKNFIDQPNPDLTNRSKEDREKLISRIRRKFIKDGIEEDYVNCMINLIQKADLDFKELYKILRRDLDNDSYYIKMAPLPDDYQPKEDEHCTDAWRTGIPLNKLDADHVMMKCFNIKAKKGKYSETFIGTGCDDNAHIDTSIMKRIQSAVIKYNKFDAVSLTNQQWLNNDGPGRRIFTGAYITQYFEDVFELIKGYGYSVLLTVEDYTPGLHLGNEYAYYCDDLGFVLGYSRGKCTPWQDKRNEFPRNGNYNGYEVQTLATVGAQRLVFLRNNVVDFVEPNHPVKVRTYPGKGKLLPPLSPKYTANLCQPKKEEVTVDEIVNVPDYSNPLLDGYCANPFKKKVDRCKETLSEHKSEVTLSVAAAAATCLNKKLAPFALLPPMVVAAKYLWKRLNAICPKLEIYPYSLVMEGKHRHDMIKTYKENPIDPVTSLPFGYYIVNEDRITQVPQGHPQANYTNVLRLVEFYCEKMKWQKTSYVSVYNATFDCMTPHIKSDCNNSFFEQEESMIREITSSTEFKINPPNEDKAFGIRLSDHDNLRDYVCSKIDRRTLTAGTAARVLRGGIQSRHSVEEHQKLLTDFWFTMVGKTYYKVDPTADISRYKGKKYRKYLQAFLDFSWKSYKVAYNSFIKVETLPSANLHKKAFRFIVPNRKDFNLANLNFFHHFEVDLLHTEHNGLPLFAKGCTYEERWKIINEYADRYLYCIPIDFKNFDAHHCKNAYRAEMMFYAVLGLAKEIALDLADAKTYGVVEHAMALRRSGDLFTGSGNCLVVLSLLYKFIKENDIGVFCDGDDTLLFVNERSIFDDIKNHLEDYGYEIDDEPNYIDLKEEDWEIPYCQTYYSKEGYYVNTERLLNKMMNVVGTSIESVTRTILGKLQAVAYFEKLGIEFDLPISDVLNGIEKSYDVEYKEQMCASLEHYLIDQSRYKYQLGAPSAGLIGDIVKTIYSKRKFLIKCNPKTRQKHLLKIISSVVIEEENKIHKLNKQCEQALARAESIVKNYGLKSIAPELADMYSNMEITHCGSKSYLKFSNPTKCIQYVSTGSQDTPNLQGVVSSCPTTLTKHKRMSHSRLVPFLPNKTPESQDLPKTAPSQSQPQVGEEPQTEECAQEQEVTSLISDMPSQRVVQHLQAQLQCGSSTMSLSTPLKLNPFSNLTYQVKQIYSAGLMETFSLSLKERLTRMFHTHGKQKDRMMVSLLSRIRSLQPTQRIQPLQQSKLPLTTTQLVQSPATMSLVKPISHVHSQESVVKPQMVLKSSRIALTHSTNSLIHRRRLSRLKRLLPLVGIGAV